MRWLLACEGPFLLAQLPKHWSAVFPAEPLEWGEKSGSRLCDVVADVEGVRIFWQNKSNDYLVALAPASEQPTGSAKRTEKPAVSERIGPDGIVTSARNVSKGQEEAAMERGQNASDESGVFGEEMPLDSEDRRWVEEVVELRGTASARGAEPDSGAGLDAEQKRAMEDMSSGITKDLYRDVMKVHNKLGQQPHTGTPSPQYGRLKSDKWAGYQLGPDGAGPSDIGTRPPGPPTASTRQDFAERATEPRKSSAVSPNRSAADPEHGSRDSIPKAIDGRVGIWGPASGRAGVVLEPAELEDLKQMGRTDGSESVKSGTAHSAQTREADSAAMTTQLGESMERAGGTSVQGLCELGLKQLWDAFSLLHKTSTASSTDVLARSTLDAGTLQVILEHQRSLFESFSAAQRKLLSAVLSSATTNAIQPGVVGDGDAVRHRVSASGTRAAGSKELGSPAGDVLEKQEPGRPVRVRAREDQSKLGRCRPEDCAAWQGSFTLAPERGDQVLEEVYQAELADVVAAYAVMGAAELDAPP